MSVPTIVEVAESTRLDALLLVARHLRRHRCPPSARTSPRPPPGALRGKILMAPDFDYTPQEIIDLFYGGGADTQHDANG